MAGLERYRSMARFAGDRYRASMARFDTERSAQAEAEVHVRHCVTAQEVIQSAAQQVQETAHRQIQSVVNRCLEAVFPDDPYTFEIQFSKKRGKTEAALVFKKGDLVLTDPMNQTSGGVVEVAALALRLACLVLQKPPVRRLLILDEPFKNVNGSDYQNRVAQLVTALADDYGVQFVIVTDDEWLKIGNVVEL